MTIAVEIAAGVVLTTALVAGMTILAVVATRGTIDVSLFAMEPEAR